VTSVEGFTKSQERKNDGLGSRVLSHVGEKLRAPSRSSGRRRSCRVGGVKGGGART